MTDHDLDRFATLIMQRRETLLKKWREQVRELPSAKGMDIPRLNNHIPALLDELAAAFR